jgi:hypothetical protein
VRHLRQTYMAVAIQTYAPRGEGRQHAPRLLPRHLPERAQSQGEGAQTPVPLTSFECRNTKRLPKEDLDKLEEAWMSYV